jgi:hypothetical protein
MKNLALGIGTIFLTSGKWFSINSPALVQASFAFWMTFTKFSHLL